MMRRSTMCDLLGACGAAQAHEGHYQAALKTVKDPDGGPFPVHPCGKPRDETRGKTCSGK